MATFLLIIIYIVFIGLGLPDSILGSAWPAIYPDLEIPVSSANLLTMLISSGTVLASFFSAKLINKFGTGTVTAVSTALTALSLLGFSLSPSLVWLCVLSLPLGAGAGAIDSALNNYVAVHYKSTHMNFLHCFYGIGVSLSPLLMSFALGVDNDWRLGYRIVFILQAVITVMAFIALPLWKKVKSLDKDEETFTPKTLTLKQMAKMPAVRTAWIMFFSTVALEFTCGIWACTFLVEAEGMTEAFAARFITIYYLGMTIGRFVSGLISTKISPNKIVYTGYATVAVALIILVLPLPATIKGISLFLIGFGNGPTFPNLTYMTPINFGKDVSQSIVGTQMAACNIGILLVPPLFGLIAEFSSLEFFPYFLLITYAIMILSTVRYHSLIKKHHKK